MNLETKQTLESQGFEVIDGAWDFNFRTRIFIRHPDGTLNPYYDYLYEVPMLPNGQQFDLARSAMPYDYVKHGDTAVKNAMSLNNVDYEEYQTDTGDLIPIPVLVGYIVLSIIMLAIVICIYYLIHPPAQEPPCGTTAKIIDISDCAKVIVMPNCDARVFDACKNEWLEDSWHTYEEKWGIIQWAIIGVVAIGAVFVIYKLVQMAEKKQYYRYYPEAPPPPPPKEPLTKRVVESAYGVAREAYRGVKRRL